MVTTHLHYGLYLADILNNHSFLVLFIMRFQWDFIYHLGLRSKILLNIYMGIVYLPLWTEKHDSFFRTFTQAR